MVGKQFLEWIRDNITNEEIYAEIESRNVKSRRVVEKLEFSKIDEAKVCRDGTDKTIGIYKWDG